MLSFLRWSTNSNRSVENKVFSVLVDLKIRAVQTALHLCVGDVSVFFARVLN